MYPASTEELATRAVPDYWRLLPYSQHAHLQNYATVQGDRPTRTLITDGVVDYAELGAASRNCGYRGSFMIEFPADERGDMSVDQAVRNDVAGVRRLLSR